MKSIAHNNKGILHSLFTHYFYRLTDYEGAKAIARRLFETYDRDKDGVIDNVEVVPMIVDAYRAFNRSFSPARSDIESYSKV